MTDQLLDLLAESRQRGFLGPGPVEDHLDRARAFAVAADRPPARAIDLGAGGGLPGLVLAATTWPETRWTFLDAALRRTEFLLEAVEELDLEDRVVVITARAEELGRAEGHRGTYDLVVARSFGPPAVTWECAAPLLVPGGRFVASEPPEVDRTLDRWPADGVALFGGGVPAPVFVDGEVPAHLVTIDLDGSCPDRYPRRVGIPREAPAVLLTTGVSRETPWLRPSLVRASRLARAVPPTAPPEFRVPGRCGAA